MAKALSLSAGACGEGGAQCVNCSAQGKTCNATTRACESAGQTGGGVGGTGGGQGGGTATGGGAATGGGTATGGGGGSGGGSSGTGGGSPLSGCNRITQDCLGGDVCFNVGTAGDTQCFPAGRCDLIQQDCATPTDKCTYGTLADGGVIRGCLPAGAKHEGEACSLGECAKSLICVDGLCHRFCYTNANCASGDVCELLLTIAGAIERPRTCMADPNCNPFTQNCDGGMGCYPTTRDTLACFTAGTVALGQVCGAGLRCAPGTVCTQGADGGAQCLNYCNRDGGEPTCAGNCNPMFMSDGGLTWFGACQ